MLGGGLALAAGCFTGSFLAGRACVADSECGPSLRCEEGVCGGPTASTGTGPLATTGTSPPTTTATEGTGSATGTGTAAAESTSSGPGPTTGPGLTGSSSSGDATSGDACDASVCDRLDLLLLIDNSPSMGQWQDGLLQALLTLGGGKVGDLVRDSCDAHVGVLTTEAPYLSNPEGCQGYGALVRFGGDKECNGGRPYATQDDDLGAALGCQALVGTAGASDERAIEALLAAMTPAFNDPGMCNDGFLRPDALLVVVLITDEDDDADDGETPDQETPGTPADWYAQVVAFKGSPERVVLIGLMGDVGGDPSCPWVAGGLDGEGAESPDRIRAFFDMFPRSVVGSLCHDKYPEFITGPVYDEVKGACEAAAS